ncbi:MAG: SGNH/GDSL hydrolase family protein [Alicyclobacillus sp.]|nr:SGNH/GDSL hydrolase family protein [Alicyclobacillus sp.]
MAWRFNRSAARWTMLAAVACVAGVIAADVQVSIEEAPSGGSGPLTEYSTVTRPGRETVMVVGGSIARGRKDPHENSYIRRAFTALTQHTSTTYVYKDRTLIGGTAYSREQRKPHEFQNWLKADKPQVVVLAWGIMSDLYAKTPEQQFEQAIHSEIQQALNAHAVVFVITPPVVKALATNQHDKGEVLMHNELQVAKSFHSPNVYTFDVFNEMAAYMKDHHQTYQLYYGDNWHPNGLGHQVAGRLLYADIAKTFGTTPIRYRAES